MYVLTRNLGNDRIENFSEIDVLKVKRILISRPNHRLGNMLLVTPLVQELVTTFPNCKIDIFSKGGITPVIFENYPQVDRIIPLPKKPLNEPVNYLKVWVKLRKHSYDLVINADIKSSSGRLATKFSRSKMKLYGNSTDDTPDMPKDYVHFAKRPIYNLRNILFESGITKELNTNPIPVPDIKLTEKEINNGKKILNSLISNPEKGTICIFTFATGAKCHSKEWWLDFYNTLTSSFPDYNIFEMLPVENVSQVDFKAKSFYSKDIREIASVFHASTIFIGADSGMMHLASASGVTTVGLFNVTNPVKYEPYNGDSLAINTTETGNEKLMSVVKTILSKN